ncbi:MAG TPA: diaminopimelate decarboxylase [Lactovum miscens]|uniref:diaminopimelate decarboxylase family protein n=1 Tax=Lactovum miscens TaxID=190387 RepID=UPI002ED8F159
MVKKLALTNQKKLEEIAHDIPTPFHLYDEKGIREKAQALNQAFSWNKGFKEYFAVKATPNPTILKILQEENCGLDCASNVELTMAKRLSFQPGEVMFSSNVTPLEDYQKARDLGAYINLDAFEHIDFLKNANFDFPKTICLRYNPGGEFHLGTDIMSQPEESKFGMTKEQILAGIIRLKDFGVKEFGIHAFWASNTEGNNYYPELARQLFSFLLEIKQETGVTLSFVNLSGGIGVNYKPTDEIADIYEIGKKVERAYHEILTENSVSNVKIFTELGRFMLGPYGNLVTRVRHLKHTYRDYVGVDASSVDLMRPSIYGAYHHITIAGKENLEETHVYDVTGSLCENNDKFAVERQLPEIEVGDLLVIHDTGAHGYSMGNQYNGKLRSAEVLLKEDGSYKLIRRAETEDDYFATFKGLNWD